MRRLLALLRAHWPTAWLAVVVTAWVFAASYPAKPKPCGPAEVVAQIIAETRPAMGPLEREFWTKAILNVAAAHPRLTPEVLAAKIAVESRFKGEAKSAAGAKGASQLMPMWTKGFDPFEIEANLNKGADVLEYELEQTKGDLYRALRRYNGGGPNGEKVEATKSYAAHILARVYLAQAGCRVREPL